MQKQDLVKLKCSKIYTCMVKWSPAYTKTNQLLEYWRMRQMYKINLYSNVCQLIVLKNQLNLKYDRRLSMKTIEGNIFKCHKKGKKIKLMAESLSIEYRSRLAEVKEEAGKCKTATYLRYLNCIENQRKLFHNIRVIEDKVRGGSTYKVVVTAEDGSKQEYIT